MKYSIYYILVTGMAEGLKIWRIFIWGHNLPPLVEIGLTYLSKSRGARGGMAPLAPTVLLYIWQKKAINLTYNEHLNHGLRTYEG